MLTKLKSIKGYKLNTLDGDIGKVKEFYFDDNAWTVRYLIADTGNWLTSKLVLISPYAIENIDTKENHVSIKLTSKQIEDSPSIDKDKPVSRQYEDSYYRYYGWPSYWVGPYLWGTYAYPYINPVQKEWRNDFRNNQNEDSHLRSTDAVSGYTVQASDDDFGHIDDFIIDDKSWTIRYLIIDTKNFWPGKRVLISPHWIKRIDWEESKVYVDLHSDTIKQAPEYNEDTEMTREYEESLHQYYDFQGYWVDES